MLIVNGILDLDVHPNRSTLPRPTLVRQDILSMLRGRTSQVEKRKNTVEVWILDTIDDRRVVVHESRYFPLFWKKGTRLASLHAVN